MTEPDDGGRAPKHILNELGFGVRSTEEGLEGSASIIPEMHVPGMANLRTSVLAVWADMVTGLLAAKHMVDRVPVTLELDIHLYRPAPSSGMVRATGRSVKKGRTVFVASVDFADDDGDVFAFGSASFMAVHDPTVRLPDVLSFDLPAPTQTLSVPLADRARCRRVEPGVVVLERSEDGLNAANTINGGLIALAVEEAAVSGSPGHTLSALDVRFLQPVRNGPVMAQARTHQGLCQVEVHDHGSHDRLAAIATTRLFTRQGR
ncbi:MAG TPA: hotdog domain-containing protein [Acidimicrobiales bacterium]|nr:hotdog domain-containing protein [Acidimicrobiales bacterium]